MSNKTILSAELLAEIQQMIKLQKRSARELARFQAILMHEKNIDFRTIEEFSGLKRSATLKWRSRLIKHGIEALIIPEPKLKSLLTKRQIATIIDMLNNKKPSDFGYEGVFWTPSILGHLIKSDYKVEYKTKKPLYLLFKKADFTYHKPGQQYRNRNQEQIDKWVENNTPIVKKHLEDENTVVLAGDEMILSTQTTFQKIWLPVGTYPKIDVSNKRANRSVYGFLNIKTGREHAFKTEYQNSEITCKVLDQLCQLYSEKRIVLLWDNAPWHRSKEVREWLGKTQYNIILIAFPPYAPELNPQEHVWKAGRSQVSHNKFIEDIDVASDCFVDYLQQTNFHYDLLDLVHA